MESEDGGAQGKLAIRWMLADYRYLYLNAPIRSTATSESTSQASDYGTAHTNAGGVPWLRQLQMLSRLRQGLVREGGAQISPWIAPVVLLT